MDGETNFSSVAPPVFDGENYQIWSVRMEAYLEALDLWEAVEEDIDTDISGNVTMAQIKAQKEKKIKKAKAKACLFAAVSSTIFTRIMSLKTAKEIWDYIKKEYEGDIKIKGMKVMNLIRDFELQKMKETETIKEYSDRLLNIANRIRLLGSIFSDSRIVEKILVTVPERFEASVTTLENTKDLSNITLSELLNALQAQEQRRSMRQEGVIEGALAIKHHESGKNEKVRNYTSHYNAKPGNGKLGVKGNYPPCRHCGKKGHPPFKCWQRPDAKCSICNQMGHEAVICQNKNQQQQGEKAEVADQEEEDQLFVATCFVGSESNDNWLIDSGCTNHMTNNKQLFRDLGPTNITKVRIGNGTYISVKGKGTIEIASCSGTKLIHDVLFVPEIEQNLLSVGQLIEKGFKVIFEDEYCMIKDAVGQNLFRVKMKKKSFSLNPLEEEQTAFSSHGNITEIWHKRLGHYHHQGLLQMKAKMMAYDIPEFDDHLPNCTACQYGKQNRRSFPAGTWRASRKLQLIHTDVAGPQRTPSLKGAVVYVKKELKLGTTAEGLVVAMSLIGATLITTCSGTISDRVGRRPMLILSSTFYFISGFIMLWSPNIYTLLIARLLDGFGVGLAVTLVPLYISETAPSEIRGMLNTLPQFLGSAGMFFAYCMVFGMSLLEAPSWRLMLGVLSAPSIIFFVLAVLYLPESPRWLVSKGKMLEAKRVLQKLRGREDVSAEMALLVEGLAVGGDTSIEEYIIGPADELIDNEDPNAEKEQIKLYGPESGLSWIAKPVTGQSTIGLASRQGSTVHQGRSFVDPIVTLFGSIHEKLPESGSMRSMLFPNFGSMFSMADATAKNEQWDEESLHREGEDYTSDAGGEDSDDNLQSPLISRQTTSMEKDMVPPHQHGVRRNSSLMQGNTGEESMGIGGGWQLAWKWSEGQGEDGKKEGGFKRIYLHEKGIAGSKRGSLVSLPGGEINEESEYIQAAALVSQPALYSKDLINHHPVGPAMANPSETVSEGVGWNALLEPGVRRALVVGVGIQMLQQFSGINGVMYYTPQILEQAGVGVLLSNLGIGSESASFLISAFTTLLMLPCIAVAMRFMDVAGRRTLLLTTIPVLIVSLVVMVISNFIDMGTIVHAIISTLCVIIYFCTFVMGYGPIPSILCSEIFPTKVRGLCIAICALVFWICDIIVTYSLPVMLTSIGLSGVFGIYAFVCIISWIFVYAKVPETKGMPLEVITEFFAVGARQADSAKTE